MSPSDLKAHILLVIADLVLNFLYYDRKEDDNLPRGRIDEAVRAGEITIAEMVAAFEQHLCEGLRDA